VLVNKGKGKGKVILVFF